MAKKHIPAKTVVVCDCCGNEIDHSNGSLEGKMEIYRNGLDSYGHAVASNNSSYDLCDTCLAAMDKAVKEVLEGTNPGEAT